MLTRNPRPETEVLAEPPRRSDPQHLADLPSMQSWLQEHIDVRVALGIGIAWFVLLTIGSALEPATDQSEPLVGILLGVTMLTLFLTMLVGLAMRRRWGIAASFVGAMVLTAMSIMCPVSGHHSFGAWWYGQMACALALVAISVVALPRGGVSAER
jgi:hypothetical protein